MPLPSGTWKANINGHETDLVLTVDAQGIVAATMFGIPFAGFWEEVRQTVSFSVSDAFFSANLIRTPNPAQPGQDVTLHLVGSVQVMVPPGPAWAPFAVRRNTYGWYATTIEQN